MCMDAYIRFVICFFFLLGALETPWANYIWCGISQKSRAMPQCHGLVLVQGTTAGRGRLMDSFLILL